jgi:hypothetical protein
MNFPWLSPAKNWLTRSADCLQDNSSARTPWKTPSSLVKDAYLQLRCLAIDVLLYCAFTWRRSHRKHSFPYIVVTFLSEGVYQPSHRNDSSSIVVCIRCRENVYEHSSLVTETARMSEYLELPESNPIQSSPILTLTHATLFWRYLARNVFPSGYLTNILHACWILTYLIHWFNNPIFSKYN